MLLFPGPKDDLSTHAPVVGPTNTTLPPQGIEQNVLFQPIRIMILLDTSLYSYLYELGRNNTAKKRAQKRWRGI
jgi:hypothetical protein